MSAPVAADRDPGCDESTVLRAQIAALEAQLVALTQLPLLVLRIDRQLRAIYVSPAVEQLTARPAAAVLGEPIHALGLPADLVERWAATLTAVFATGQPAQISFAVPSAAGPRHYDARLIPETAPNGTVATVLVSAYDVTDRAATLHANAERLDLILRHLPITFFAQDADLRYTWITNPQLGFLTEEVLGKTDADLLPTASATSLAALKRTVLERGVGMHTEVRITRAGDERLYDLTIEPIRDAAGAPCGVLCAALDVTERQQLEAQLHHHQALLQSLVNHAPAIIAVKDLAGRFLLVNQQLATALGREPASLLNQTVDDLFPPAIAAAMRANDQQVLRTSQPLEVEESILIGGEQHTQLAVLFPIVDALGAPSALGLVATDITAHKRAEEALRASEVRQAFLMQLNDTLRSLADPLAIQATACRLLGEYLGVNGVTYADIDGDEFILRPGYVHGITPMLGRSPLASFGATLLEAYRRGETIAVADTSTDERFTAEERAAFQVAQIAAFTGVVRIKAARWVGLFGTQSVTPRTW
ncbi:MAG: PAS domain-containing protein, partial [Chloroflexales bacterium]|nr:PAS domain-containing protein [Chloroflexales bacterium]